MVGSVLSVINYILHVDQSQSQASVSVLASGSNTVQYLQYLLVAYPNPNIHTHLTPLPFIHRILHSIQVPFRQLIQLILLHISVALSFPCYCTITTIAVRLVVFPHNQPSTPSTFDAITPLRRRRALSSSSPSLFLVCCRPAVTHIGGNTALT